jgi:hypothetical protein
MAGFVNDHNPWQSGLHVSCGLFWPEIGPAVAPFLGVLLPDRDPVATNQREMMK